MKLSRLLLVLFTFCTVTLTFSQGNWELLHPQVTANQMVCLDFIDAETGLAVGEVGTILKTTDGGDSWRIISIPWTANLTDIDFVTPDLAYIIGESGVIMKTADGGESWTLQPIEFTNTLNRVRFYDANEGWIVGDTGLILRTTDGGENWNRIITSYKYKLTGLASVDRDTWVVIGAGLTILRTEDSGGSWEKISVEIFNPDFYTENDYTPLDIYFLNDRVGWIAGKVVSPRSGSVQSFIYKTTNAGASWQISPIQEGSVLTLDGGKHELGTAPIQIASGIQQIYFQDTLNGMCLTGPAFQYSTNYLYHTADGGKTWYGRMAVNKLTSGAPARFCFLTNEKAICTYSGTGFLSSNDGGLSWQGDDFWQKLPWELVIGNNGVMTVLGNQLDISISWEDFAAGNTRRIGIAYQSMDYGNTWREVSTCKTLQYGATVPLNMQMDVVPLRRPEQVWGVDWNSGLSWSVFKTPDVGLTWNYLKKIQFHISLEAIHVSGDTLIQSGFIRGDADEADPYHQYNYTVMVSYDGGKTSEFFEFPDLWNEITLSGTMNFYYYNRISGYHFFSTQHWIVVGSDGNIVMTTDGGRSWKNIPSGVADNLQDIRFVNANTGFIVGDFGRILKSVDGGLTWRKTNSGTQNNIYSIIFEDELTGWAGTSRGLLYTIDGGESWDPVTGQSINGMVGCLERDAAGNIYGYWITPYFGGYKNRPMFSYPLKESVPPGFMCLKRAGTSLVADKPATKPEQFRLYPNYPNPFNSNTMIKYDLKQAGEIKLAIYNIQGKRVRNLESGYQTAGSHNVRWDGRDQRGQSVSSGVYILRLNSEGNQQSQKMLYLR